MHLPSWLTHADHNVQGLAVRLAELLAAPSLSGSAAAVQPAGASAAGGSAGPAPVARDPVEAISQSVLIPMLMQELNQATFTGVPASCLRGVSEHCWALMTVRTHEQMCRVVNRAPTQFLLLRMQTCPAEQGTMRRSSRWCCSCARTLKRLACLCSPTGDRATNPCHECRYVFCLVLTGRHEAPLSTWHDCHECVVSCIMWTSHLLCLQPFSEQPIVRCTLHHPGHAQAGRPLSACICAIA
jgi:hypothetical protein